MIKKWQNTTASIIILIFGISLFYFGTDGFQAFTAEAARVNKLIDEKPIFPGEVTFEDSKERKYPISEFKGKYVFITFMYTSCTTVCPQLEVNMSKVYEQVPKKYLGKDVVFLSISFDPERDTPARLEQYRTSFHSDGETWRMARINNMAELDSLLKEFGVIVIPDGYGNFAHNSAFYLVDQNGTLIDVMDFKKTGEAAEKLVGMLDKNGGSK